MSVLLVKERNKPSDERLTQVNENRHQSSFWMISLSFCISNLIGAKQNRLIFIFPLLSKMSFSRERVIPIHKKTLISVVVIIEKRCP